MQRLSLYKALLSTQTGHIFMLTFFLVLVAEDMLDF